MASEATEARPHEPSLEVFDDALMKLGSAWREDWSEFDGRTLRSQLDGLRRQFRAAVNGRDVRREIQSEVEMWGVCWTCGAFNEHCLRASALQSLQSASPAGSGRKEKER